VTLWICAGRVNAAQFFRDANRAPIDRFGVERLAAVLAEVFEFWRLDLVKMSCAPPVLSGHRGPETLKKGMLKATRSI
jgi:hypothetical protein